jgi:hypothetical protein
VSYSDLLMEHPGLARSALVTWPQGPRYLDLLELVLRLLTAGGVPAARAAWAVDTLLQSATAMAAEYGTRGERATAQSLDELTAALAGASAVRHPLLAALGPEGMTSGDPLERRRWALDALINGVLATPRAHERR